MCTAYFDSLPICMGVNFKAVSAIRHILRSSEDLSHHSLTALLGGSELRTLTPLFHILSPVPSLANNSYP
jgi:hypothetical protein